MIDTNALLRFISEISFRHLQPEEPFPPEFGGCDTAMYLPPKTRTLIETWNIDLPVTAEMFAKLQDLGILPRMSTLAVGAIIQRIVSEMPPDHAYVNVGFWNGFSLFAGMMENPDKTCIGIDNFSQFDDPRDVFLVEFSKRKSAAHRFCIQDYRDYFTQHREPIGFYFYDGNHDYLHQKEGLKLADPFIASGGMILVDDTNWEGPRNATEDFLKEHTNYECIVDRGTAHNSHPTFWNGMMILRKS